MTKRERLQEIYDRETKIIKYHDVIHALETWLYGRGRKSSNETKKKVRNKIELFSGRWLEEYKNVRSLKRGLRLT